MTGNWCGIITPMDWMSYIISERTRVKRPTSIATPHNRECVTNFRENYQSGNARLMIRFKSCLEGAAADSRRDDADPGRPAELGFEFFGCNLRDFCVREYGEGC